ncbi:MAG: type IV pilus biogenesis protein PilM [Elusimicrobiota bacterium]
MSQFDLDALINQLAFGKTAPANLPALGMYIGQDVIYLAETAIGANREVSVRHLMRLAVPVPGSDDQTAIKIAPTGTGIASIEKGFPETDDKYVGMIKQAISQSKWGTKNVVVTLSHQMSILRYFVMPAMERRFWKSAVPLQARRYIPLSFEGLSQDYQVVPAPHDSDQRPRSGVLFAVTAKNNLVRLSEFTKKLGLDLLGVETSCVSALRLWENRRQKGKVNVYCRVHFDGGNIRIVLVDNGIPIFFREVFLGNQPSLQDQRRLDLEGCVTFAQKQLGVTGIDAVFLSGNGVVLDQWQDALGRELGVAAAVVDEAKAVGIKEGSWEGYSALGASIKLAFPSAASLDLARIGKISEEETRTVRSILAVSCVTALWFAAIGVFHFISYQLQARKLHQYKPDPEVHAAFLGKDNSDISLLLKSMRDQLGAMGNISHPPVSLAAILKDVGDVIPAGVWLTDITYGNQAASSDLSAVSNPDLYGPQLNLRGNCQAATTGEGQDLAYQFRDKLNGSKIAGKVFGQIQMSIQNASQDGGLKAASAGSAGKITSFAISARAKKS